MKKNFKRILSLCIAVMMLCSVMFTGVLTVNATEYKVGDIVEFGSYPQTEIKDEATLKELNSISKTWISYEYYTGMGYHYMHPSDYMKYADVNYKNEWYRAVMFSQYRPNSTLKESTPENSYQDENGYITDTVYWFKYEPLKWRVLDLREGLVLSEKIIDSQAYSNTCYSEFVSSEDMYYFFNDSEDTNYANDYATSSIRVWLNDNFYNTAFNSSEKSMIMKAKIDALAYSDKFSEYNSSKSVNDNVFLLSYSDVLNENYSFISETSENNVRVAYASEYAKCQGLYLQKDYAPASFWKLRTPADSSLLICGVGDSGYVYVNCDVNNTCEGIRPALKISNLSTITEDFENTSNSTPDIGSKNTSSFVSGLTLGNFTFTIIAVALGISLGAVVMFVVMKKKNSSANGKSNSTKTTDTDFSEIVSFAPLTDEQLEALTQKLNEQNAKTKFKNFKLK